MTKTILVAGATGKTGRHLVRTLLDQARARSRLSAKAPTQARCPKASPLRQGDLTDLQQGVCEGVDVVVFAAGSGGSTGPE
jgi:nucleoside-diphosphate-sugar epimerase